MTTAVAVNGEVAPCKQQAKLIRYGLDSAPCDVCAHALQCCAQHLACREFVRYINTGRWKGEAGARPPTRHSYLRSFTSLT